MSTGLVWFRRDLRVHDNPALDAATAAHEHVVALYVLDARLVDSAGPHRRRLALAHVAALRDALDGALVVRTGDPTRLVPELAAAARAELVHWNADVTPFARSRDEAVTAALAVPARAWWGQYVHAPGRVVGASGAVSRVFTPFHRRWEATDWEPWPQPGAGVVGRPHRTPFASDPFPDLDGDPPMPAGEDAAAVRLATFCERADRYAELHDVPAVAGTSQLSADLRFGVLSPRAVALAVGDGTPGRAAFVRQLAWRDWYAHLLAAMPHLVDTAMRPHLDRVPWRDDEAGFAAWRAGRTGYPLVDAGMRELRATGWMHNRVRMVTASFLVKDLLVDWRRGERWFRHLLVDGDVPQNVGNWQWVAGTGPDAAPYFRVINPVTQSRRFDAAGDYVRRWVPELAGLDGDAVHAPWEAGPIELAAAGVVLGDTYPAPIVDHAAARDRALGAYGAASS